MEENIDLFQIMLDSSVVVKLVLLILVISSIYSLAIAWKKFNDLRIVEKQNKLFLKIYRNQDSFDEIIDSIKKLKVSTLKRMFVKGCDELNRIKRKKTEEPFEIVLENYIYKFGLNSFERSLDQGMIEENDRLNIHLSSLASIGSITPFIGLFGTVWGIIDAFRGLASSSTASLDAVAPGMAEALVATAMGLFAAIPAVWFFNYFSSRNDSINAQMASFSKEFLNTIEHLTR